MTGVGSEYIRKNSLGKSSQPRSSISQSSSYQKPQSALRTGKYDTSNSKLNDLKFDLSEIHDTYGYELSLYDVLSIDRNASASEIKASYLNKGREILLAGRSTASDSEVTDRSRKEFQAISLAYEILSKEDLRALYDGRCSITRKNNVQWSKVVHEKVIKDAHPNEHSHRRYSKRTPPPYHDDACSGLDDLDDEIDELMLYCNDDDGVNFIEFAELQHLVESFNTSMKARKANLLESFEEKMETERQPSEEVASIEEDEDQRQPPAEITTIQTHGDRFNFVCKAAEEAIFPVKGDVNQTANKNDVGSSSMAIAVIAAAAVASAMREVEVERPSTSVGCFTCGDLEAFADEGGEEIIDSDPIEKEFHASEPEEIAVHDKSKSLSDKNIDEKQSSDTSPVAGTAAGWFAFGGASIALQRDEDKNCDNGNVTKDDGNDVAVEESNDVAAKATTNKRGVSSTRLRKAVANRMKFKSLADTVDEGPPTEITIENKADASIGWLFCCGATEYLGDDEDDITVTDSTDNKVESMDATKEEEAAVVEEGTGSVPDEGAVTKTMMPSTKIRRAVVKRLKTKSRLSTKDQKPPTEIKPGTAVMDASAGWFACCGASEALANNDEVEVIEDKKVEIVDLESEVEDGLGSVAQEGPANKKVAASAKMRKAMAIRLKSRSRTKDQGPPTEVTVEASTGTGWFACCGASEAFANNDADDVDQTKAPEKKVDDKSVVDEDLGGRAEEKPSPMKSNTSKKLMKSISIRTKSNNSHEKQSNNNKTSTDDISHEEDSLGVIGLFCCSGAAETTLVKEEEQNPTKQEKGARKLRNQYSIRKMAVKPLMDIDESNECVSINAEDTTAVTDTKIKDTKTWKNIRMPKNTFKKKSGRYS